MEEQSKIVLQIVSSRPNFGLRCLKKEVNRDSRQGKRGRGLYALKFVQRKICNERESRRTRRREG